MVRYPDKAILHYSEIITQGDDGFPEVEEKSLELEGRFEPNVKDGFGFSGKFFCKKQNLEAFKLDNSRLEIETRGDQEFSVKHLYNYQNHCEIWVL